MNSARFLWRRFLLLVWLQVTLNACTAAAPEATPTGAPTELPVPTSQVSIMDTSGTPNPSFRIIAYATQAIIPEIIPYDRLTHLNYAFLIPNADGTFHKLANPWKLKEIVEQAHAQNVRVLISVGGWGWDEQFEALAAEPATRAVFVKELVNFVEQYSLDGTDIDWEYPDPGLSSQNFMALIQELRLHLPADKLLTAAVVAQGETAEGVPAESFELMDFVNIMAYDMGDEGHATIAGAERALNYWLRRGLPSEKAVLGVPFYARPNGVAYFKLVRANPQAPNLDEMEFNGAQVNYNGIHTMRQKTRLAKEKAGGIMFWTLEFDTTGDTSLLKAIHEAATGGGP